MLKEFRAFLLRGNVVDLAVGIVIGAAFGTMVSALVDNIFSPIIGLVTGGVDLTDKAISIGDTEDADITYGAFINSVISFVLVGAAVFFFVVKPINRLMASRKTEKPVEAPTKVCPECLSNIPQKARRCAFCASPQPG